MPDSTPQPPSQQTPALVQTEQHPSANNSAQEVVPVQADPAQPAPTQPVAQEAVPSPSQAAQTAPAQATSPETPSVTPPAQVTSAPAQAIPAPAQATPAPAGPAKKAKPAQDLHVVQETSRWSKRDLVSVLLGAILIGIVSWFLFSIGESSTLFSDLSRSDQLVRTEGNLTIAYDQPLTTYEPTASGVVTRGYLANAYEGLVAFDRDFNLKPSLALSWGMLDDTTWQFKLRPKVTFHDGSSFEADDVEASIERAQTHQDSQLGAMVATIESVQVVDDLTLRIETVHPDPLLLNKLTTVWIAPSELNDQPTSPVGTGPYAFVRDNGQDQWSFARNDDYWGELPSYPELTLRWVPDKFERYESFLAGNIDVLAQVPPVFVDALVQMGYPVANYPSLEVNFLLFGWDENSPLRHESLREAIVQAFNPEDVMTFTSGFARPSDQFVSRGVEGYVPDLEGWDYDPYSARKLVDSFGKSFTLTFNLPQGMENFGAYVEGQLKTIGLNLDLEMLPVDEYEKKVQSGESDLVFLGWRSELGDATDFFTHVVHSQTSDGRYGSLNGDRYQNEAIDALIENLEEELLETSRRESLQKLMELVVQDEIIGVPLFESEALVAIQDDLTWEPRLDNLILAQDFY